jgi:hypothetical protein
MHHRRRHVKDATGRAFKAYYDRWKFRHPSTADLRETLAEVTGQRQIVESVFAQQIYKVSKVDDRVSSITSVAQKPQPGTYEVKGKWVELTAKEADKQAEAAEEKWDKEHPKAKEGTGPYPFLTTVTLRRRGAPVPQTVLVKFADGSQETAVWDDEQQWKKFTWTKPVKAVSAELDPKRQHYLDANKLDDSRTIKADTTATQRWTFDFAALIQMILSLIATV